ncbi:MAG: acetyl-CoA carboxylase biotin carboxyl carrier protein [Spirochaetes bacterium]|nr:acetyl-CoA carboxylase biotin carboxyl carrier protein [Spirochaetota bacterium]
MDVNNIKTLAKLLDESGLSAIEIIEGKTKIRLERNIVHNTVVHQAPAAPGNSDAGLSAAQAQTPASISSDNAIDFNNVSEFRSPIIGVFCAAPTPGAKPFVQVGDRVKKGDVLCIIEAMKALNEITSDRDGEIVDICVQNGQVVEYSQVLFKIF